MNELQIFSNDQFGQIRTTVDGGEPLFVAADVCKALGIENSRMAMSRLDDDEKGVSSTDTLGGTQMVTSDGMVGRKFGRLAVLRFCGINNDRRKLWLCKCTCGNKKIVSEKQLKNGRTKSCGCLQRDIARKNSTTHGLYHTRLHNIWSNMKSRCNNKKDYHYPRWGGRGISVCDEWKEFQPFYQWAIGHGYSDDLTLDRVDNDGNYEPSNCRWATIKEQNANKRNSKSSHSDGHTSVSKTPKVTGRGQQYFVGLFLGA